MKVLRKLKVGMAVLAGAVFSMSAALAQAPSNITVSDAVRLNAADAVDKVFHVTMAKGGVLVLAINGNDRFQTIVENAKYTEGKLDGKVAYVEFGKEGQHAIGASTVCGVAFSVVVDVYEQEKAKPMSQSLPKVVIDAPKECIL